MTMIHSLFRYPVKGFSGQPLDFIQLNTGQGIEGDRSFAITDGSWVHEDDPYQWRQKLVFLGLMKYPALSALRLTMDPTNSRLSVESPNGESISAEIHDSISLDRFIDFLLEYLKVATPGRPKFVRGDENRFTDMAMFDVGIHGYISVINLASVRDLTEKMGLEYLDPMRFRANIYIDTGVPWEEREWLGRPLRIGSALTHVVMNTTRCVITAINPETGIKDAGVLQTLLKSYGHKEIGIFVDVTRDGLARIGDEVFVSDETPAVKYAETTARLNNVDYQILLKSN
jgi:uncharacterized protein